MGTLAPKQSCSAASEASSLIPSAQLEPSKRNTQGGIIEPAGRRTISHVTPAAIGTKIAPGRTPRPGALRARTPGRTPTRR
jgi:hypothetical protein